ncbi:hypothetical protein P4200_24420 [Pseudomonas aeruginosa]|nr:hypothetical protein [Pseudomonas aeruginosa]
MAVRARGARHLPGQPRPGLRAANPALAQMLGYDDPQQVLWSLEDMAGQLFVGGEAEMRRIRALLRERGGLFG